MKPNKRKRPQRTAPLWMVTYSDMVTLILVFFILLFSMSQIDAIKFNAVAESYRQNVIFDFMPSAIPLENPTDYEESEDDGDLTDEELEGDELEEENEEDFEQEFEEEFEDEGESESGEQELTELREEVEQYSEDNELSQLIYANRTERGVVLVLQEQVLFETAEANLVDEGLPFLNKVGALLENIPNNVKVEGHTDARPINSAIYPSNWELSGARASSVVRYFIEELEMDETRFQAVGFSDTRPIVENDGPESWEQNRRVELVITETSEN
ncbi:flagellar motor protein MotS [Halalkalibacillus halophilus]|uniref:flagellar motor protein MotS n=1 Tax=Halalkalibacillus halophilus TaxID=392827 RepID=UPI0004212010|nr:flagellar motor protein MotS [Halalkalibacillus halophilus]